MSQPIDPYREAPLALRAHREAPRAPWWRRLRAKLDGTLRRIEERSMREKHRHGEPVPECPICPLAVLATPPLATLSPEAQTHLARALAWRKIHDAIEREIQGMPPMPVPPKDASQ